MALRKDNKVKSNFSKITISLASPETILQRSSGEVLKPETINLFTSYGSDISRRGLGFDKPEKDNAIRKEPYPSLLVSPETFGHTGFTGTCVWVDPANDLVYIFLSNRVYPTRDNNKLGQLLIRGKIQDAIYRALGL